MTNWPEASMLIALGVCALAAWVAWLRWGDACDEWEARYWACRDFLTDAAHEHGFLVEFDEEKMPSMTLRPGASKGDSAHG